MAFVEKNMAEHVTNDGRRYSLIVSSTTLMLDGSGVVAVGELHGHAKVGDEVYVLQPDGKAFKTKILGMETMVEERMVIADEATDAPTNMQLETKAGINIGQFAVITSVRPQSQVDVNEAVENPYLASMLYGLQKFSKDNKYFSTLSFLLAHSTFVTPLKMETPPQDNGDGTATFTKDTRIGFYMVKGNKIEDIEGEFLLPVFTDWEELHKWKGLAESEEQVRTMLLKFQDAIKIIGTPNFQGFVINPFSRNQMLVNKKLIKVIEGMPGYQAEFGEGAKKDPISQEVQMKKGTQIMLGVPSQTPEVDNIKAELQRYGANNPDIRSISLMLKLEEDKKTQRYFIILDVDKAVAKEHMAHIFKAINTFAVNVKAVEFALKGDVPQIDQIAANTAEKSLIYAKVEI